MLFLHEKIDADGDGHITYAEVAHYFEKPNERKIETLKGETPASALRLIRQKTAERVASGANSLQVRWSPRFQATVFFLQETVSQDAL